MTSHDPNGPVTPSLVDPFAPERATEKAADAYQATLDEALKLRE